jgi:hypothetical protein
VRIDRRYNNPYRLTRYAKRVISSWGVAMVVVIVLLDVTHGWLPFRAPTTSRPASKRLPGHGPMGHGRLGQL